MKKDASVYSKKNIISRDYVQEFVLALDVRYNVNEWKCNNIHLWPYLRILLESNLDFELDNKKLIDNKKEKKQEIKPFRLLNPIKKIVFGLGFFIWYSRLPKKRKLFFVGADHYRAEHEGKRYNKFYDLLIEKYDLYSHSISAEIGPSRKDTHPFPGLHIDLEKGMFYFLKLQSLKRNFRVSHAPLKWKLSGYDTFINELKEIPETRDFAIRFSGKNLEKQMREWFDFHQFFQLILKRMGIQRVVVICFFEKVRMALMAAANSLNIPTVEMQHGPVNMIPYIGWDSIPKEGYDMLPVKYWCWDAYSKGLIDKWAEGHSKYEAINAGNPWLNFWQQKLGMNVKKNIILYTLAGYKNDILFPKPLLNAIRSTDYPWYIRMHPDWIEAKDQLVSFLEAEGLMNKVNLEDAFSEPLPVLLQKSVLHITLFSGSSIEASLLGTHTVFIHSLGPKIYPDILENQMARYLDPAKPDFSEEINKLLNSQTVKQGELQMFIDNEPLKKMLLGLQQH